MDFQEKMFGKRSLSKHFVYKRKTFLQAVIDTYLIPSCAHEKFGTRVTGNP